MYTIDVTRTTQAQAGIVRMLRPFGRKLRIVYTMDHVYHETVWAQVRTVHLIDRMYNEAVWAQGNIQN